MASWEKGRMKLIVSLSSLPLVRYLAENKAELPVEGVRTQVPGTLTPVSLSLVMDPRSVPGVTGEPGAAQRTAVGRDEFTQNTRQQNYG